MQSPLEELMAQPDVSDTLEEAPQPLELPAQTERRNTTLARVRAKLTADDFKARGIPFYQAPGGRVQELTDPTSGTPLTRYSKRNQVAFNAMGEPRRIAPNPLGGMPIVGDAYEGAPQKTDRQGNVYDAPPGVAWRPTGETDPAIIAKNQAALNRETDAALAGPDAEARAAYQASHQQARVSAKATAKALAGLGVATTDANGLPINLLNADRETMRAHIEEATNREYAAPEANAAPIFGGSRYTAEADQLRKSIGDRKAQALAVADQHLATLDTMRTNRSALEEIKAQRRTLKGDRLTAVNEKRVEAGLAPVTVPEIPGLSADGHAVQGDPAPGDAPPFETPAVETGEIAPSATPPGSLAIPETVPTGSDFLRGAKTSLMQLPALAKGTLGLLGATAEKVVGEGGIASGIKQWGLKGYEDGMTKTQEISHENDDVTTAWAKAKEGDIGALVDWAQYGAGYLLGQAGETLGIAALGGLVGGVVTSETGPGAVLGAGTGAVAGAAGKQVAKAGIKAMIEKIVSAQALRLAEKQAVKTATAEEIAQLAAMPAMRKAAAASIGQGTAIAANSLMMEAGGIFPEAVKQAQAEGRELSGTDMAKVWATSIAAGGIDAMTDKLGLDLALGKLPRVMKGRVGNALATGAAAAAVEGGTEVAQTGLERLGAGQSLTDEEAQKDYINSGVMGALGGTLIGGGSALVHGAPAIPGTVAPTIEPPPATGGTTPTTGPSTQGPTGTESSSPATPSAPPEQQASAPAVQEPAPPPVSAETTAEPVTVESLTAERDAAAAAGDQMRAAMAQAELDKLATGPAASAPTAPEAASTTTPQTPTSKGAPAVPGIEEQALSAEPATQEAPTQTAAPEAEVGGRKPPVSATSPVSGTALIDSTGNIRPATPAAADSVTLYHASTKKFPDFDSAKATPTGLGGSGHYFNESKPNTAAYGPNVTTIKVPRAKLADLRDVEKIPGIENVGNIDQYLRDAGYAGTYNSKTGEYVLYDPNPFIEKAGESANAAKPETAPEPAPQETPSAPSYTSLENAAETVESDLGRVLKLPPGANALRAIDSRGNVQTFSVKAGDFKGANPMLGEKWKRIVAVKLDHKGKALPEKLGKVTLAVAPAPKAGEEPSSVTVSQTPGAKPPDVATASGAEHATLTRHAETFLATHAAELKALGHDGKLTIGTTKAASGLETRSGRIVFDPAMFAADNDSLDPAKRLLKLQRAMAEEVFHLGTLEYASESDANRELVSAQADDAEWQTRGREVYGPEWDARKGETADQLRFRQGAEIARMIWQGDTNLTEASYKFLDSFLKWLKAKIGNLPKASRELISEIEARMGRAKPKTQEQAHTPEGYKEPWRKTQQEWIRGSDVRKERRESAVRDVEDAVKRLGRDKVGIVHGLKADEDISDWLQREKSQQPTWGKGGQKSGQTAIQKWAKKITLPNFKDEKGEERLRVAVLSWIRGQNDGWLQKGEGLDSPRFSTAIAHRKIVEQAIREKQPVPPEVLADYPDLAPKPATKPTEEPAPISKREAAAKKLRDKLGGGELAAAATKDDGSLELAGAENASDAVKDRAAKLWKEKGTESPFFKKWFGESRVVNADGEPLVVYHGTRANFTEFDQSKGDLGFHFGTEQQARNRTNSSTVIHPGKGDTRLISAHLSIKKPLVMPDIGSWDDPNHVGGHVSFHLGKGFNQYIGSFAEVRQMLEKAGYDGIRYANQHEGNGVSWIAIRPNQIKSATGNQGTFDPNNPSILAAASTKPISDRETRLAAMEYADALMADGITDPAEFAREVQAALGFKRPASYAALWNLAKLSGAELPEQSEAQWGEYLAALEQPQPASPAAEPVAGARVEAEQFPLIPEVVEPAPAVAKAAEKQADAPDTSAKKMKVQKAYLLEALDKAIEEAPDELPEGSWKIIDAAKEKAKEADSMSRGTDKERAAKQAEAEEQMREMRRTVPHITIEVPGDGTFTLINTKDNLKAFRKVAQKFPVSTQRPDEPSSPASNPTQVPALKKPKGVGDAIKVASMARSEDPEREVLNYVFSNGKDIVATDGRRLILLNESAGGSEKEPKFFTADAKITKPVSKEERDKSGKVTSPGGEPLKYPAYRQVIPDAREYEKVGSADTASLFRQLAQARRILTEKDTSIRLWSDNGDIGITAIGAEQDRNETGWAGGEYSSGVDEDKAKFLGNINAEYLMDAMKMARALGHEQVEIRVRGQKPGDSTTESDPSFHPLLILAKGMTQVIMPVRGAVERTKFGDFVAGLAPKAKPESKIAWLHGKKNEERLAEAQANAEAAVKAENEKKAASPAEPAPPSGPLPDIVLKFENGAKVIVRKDGDTRDGVIAAPGPGKRGEEPTYFVRTNLGDQVYRESDIHPALDEAPKPTIRSFAKLKALEKAWQEAIGKRAAADKAADKLENVATKLKYSIDRQHKIQDARRDAQDLLRAQDRAQIALESFRRDHDVETYDYYEYISHGKELPPDRAELYEDIEKPKVTGFEPATAPSEPAAERKATIDRILAAARDRMPEIVETFETKGDNGQWYGLGGFPMGVKMTGERRSAGFVIRNPEGTTGGIRLPTREEQEQRQRDFIERKQNNFRTELEKMNDEQLASQDAFWAEEKAKSERRAEPLPSQAKAPSSDALDLRRLLDKKYKTAGDEKTIERLKRQLAADPSKWSVGNGVAYKVAGGSKPQTNRGFRIVAIDAEKKMAKIRQVADTGLTSTGGDNDHVGDQWMHIGDLIREKKYDAAERNQEPLGAAATGGGLQDIMKRWDDRGIDNFVSEKNGIITLSKIVVKKGERERGIGTAAMRELMDYADRTGQQIALTPSGDFGGNKQRLVQFYRKLGFRTYKGFKVREKLIRDPKQTDTGTALYAAATKQGDNYEPDKARTSGAERLGRHPATAGIARLGGDAQALTQAHQKQYPPSLQVDNSPNSGGGSTGDRALLSEVLEKIVAETRATARAFGTKVEPIKAGTRQAARLEELGGEAMFSGRENTIYYKPEPHLWPAGEDHVSAVFSEELIHTAQHHVVAKEIGEGASPEMIRVRKEAKYRAIVEELKKVEAGRSLIRSSLDAYDTGLNKPPTPLTLDEASKDMSKRIGMALELERQLIQLRRDGQLTELTMRNALQRLTDWFKKVLAELRRVAREPKNVSPMLAQSIRAVESALNGDESPLAAASTKQAKPFRLSDPAMGAPSRKSGILALGRGSWMTAGGDIIPVQEDHETVARHLLGMPKAEKDSATEGLNAAYEKGLARVLIQPRDKQVLVSGKKLTTPQKRNLRDWGLMHGYDVKDFTDSPDQGYFTQDEPLAAAATTPPAGPLPPGSATPGPQGPTPPNTPPGRIDSVLNRILHAGRWFWEGSADVLDRAGYKDLAAAIKKQFDVEAREFGQTWKPLRTVLEAHSAKTIAKAKTEWSEYFTDRENGRATQAAANLPNYSKAGKELIAAWKMVAVETGKHLTKLGVEVRDGDKWRPIGNLGERFFPRKINQATMKVLQEPENHTAEWAQLTQDLIANGNIQTPAEADAFLKKHVFHEDSVSDHFGNIERARIGKLPESWLEYKFDEVAPWYTAHYARRIGQIEAYGQEHQGGDLFDKTIETIPKRKPYNETQEYVQAAKDAAYMRRDNTGLAQGLRNLQTFATGAFLTNPMSAIRNVTSGVSQTAVLHGPIDTLRAAWETMRDFQGKINDAHDLGVLRDDLMQMMVETRLVDEPSIAKGVRKGANLGLKWSGFNLAENFARSVALTAAKNFADTYQNATGAKKDQMTAFLTRHGVDPAKIAAGDREETNRFLRSSVRESQGGYKFDQVPLYFSNPVVGFLTQFGKWGTQMTRMWAKHALNPAIHGTEVNGKRVRTFAPLLYSMAFAIGGGELLYLIKSLFTDRDRPDASVAEIGNALTQNQAEGVMQLFNRAASDVINAGTLGMLSDYAGNLREFATRGRFKNPFNPPGVQAFANVFNILATLKQQRTLTGKDVLAAFETQFPGVKFADQAARKAIGEPVQAARSVQSSARHAGMRMAKELGLPVQAPFTASMPVKSPKSPFYSAINDALLAGDAIAARKAKASYLVSLRTPEERKKAESSIATSVSQKQPISVGGITGANQRSEFLRWAKTRLPATQFAEIMDLDRRYWATARAAGIIMQQPQPKQSALATR